MPTPPSQNEHPYLPTSLDFINRPNPIEPHAAPHQHPLNNAPRPLETRPQDQDYFRRIRNAQNGPNYSRAPAKRRESPGDAGMAAAGGGIMDLPRLPVPERGRKRLRIPPTLSGLQNPPPDAGLLPSMAVERPARAEAADGERGGDLTRGVERRMGGALTREGECAKGDRGETNDRPEEIPDCSGTPKKSKRNRWTEEETACLLKGVARFGIGNWTKILQCPRYSFERRTALDLKDRFRVCCPEKYRADRTDQAATLPGDAAGVITEADYEGPSEKEGPKAKRGMKPHKKSSLELRELGIVEPFTKAKRRKRTKYTKAEDEALLTGFRKYGNAWASIREDKSLNLRQRQPTDLRDRMRTRYPDEYKTAGLALRKGVTTARGSNSSSAPTVSMVPGSNTDSRYKNPRDADPPAKAPDEPSAESNTQRLPPTSVLTGDASYEGDAFFSPLPDLEDERITLDRRILDWPSENPRSAFLGERPVGIDPLATLNLPRPTATGSSQSGPGAAFEKPTNNSTAALPSLAEMTAGEEAGEVLELPSLRALERNLLD